MKIIAPTITAHRAARAAGVYEAGNPRPVDAAGKTPPLWASCVGWEVEDSKATNDTQDLVSALDAGLRSGKVRAQDDTAAKLKTRLAAEITKAKADRESGKAPGRPAGEIRTQRLPLDAGQEPLRPR